MIMLKKWMRYMLLAACCLTLSGVRPERDRIRIADRDEGCGGSGGR